MTTIENMTVLLLLILATSLCHVAAAATSNSGRGLAKAVMAGYQTTVDVTDYARIDMDQQYINRQVDLASQDAFEDAKNVYELGAFSKSIATVTLVEAFGLSVERGASMAGRSESGAAVAGVAVQTIRASDTTVQMQYVSEGCNVGGLATSSPVTDGCLAADGALNIEGTTVRYTDYSATSDTSNGRSIQSFSTEAETTMQHPGSGTYYPDYNKFVTYYGSTTYADDIVQAAFFGRLTSLKNGNMDLSSFGYEGRAEAVKITSAYMSTLMQFLAELESALYVCLKCNQNDCRVDALSSLDQAVALYTGSLEGASGGTSGNDGMGLYTLTERRGVDFLTAPTGTSQVNIDIMSQLNQMKDALNDGNCARARSNKIQIAKIIFVPLIQSTIRSTWILNATNADEAAEVEAMTFAASVLPVVSDCSALAAEIVYTQIQETSPDFATVKSALEQTYDCMGISCADVGGYWDTGNKNYYPEAAPCSGSCSFVVGLKFIITIAAIGMVLLA